MTETRTGRATVMDGCALGLGVICLSAGLAAQGGRVGAWLDMPSHFAPFWLAGAVAVTLYGLFFAKHGRRRTLIVIGILGAVAAAVLIAPEFTRPIPRVAPGGRTLKLIQFNVWDETKDPEATAAWIAGERPDIVFTEEVEPPIKAALIARGFVCTPGFGHVAIFSRDKPIHQPAPLALAEWRKMPPFAWATFGAGAGRYTVVAAHTPQPTFRVAGAQRRMLATFLRRYDARRLIVAGDFNLTPWSFALRGLDRSITMRRVDRAELTWPGHVSLGRRQIATIPLLPIDHVYAGSAWRLVSVERGPALGSDHFPLEIVLSESE